MSQTWTDDVYALSHTGSTDLQNMENNFTTLKSLFSGASAPSNNVAGMPWFDTTQKLLKIRNQANSGWLGVMYGDTTYKMYVYSNSAGDGWVIDSSVTDRVLAIKGGTQAYNVSGGATAGTWYVNLSNSTESVAHTHTGTVNTYHRHENNIGAGGGGFAYGDGSQDGLPGYYSDYQGSSSQSVTIGTESANHTHTISGSTWRPAAAVGTLQYPNV